jgi:hypothetical protein
MKTTMKILFLSVEVNLVLWLMLGGFALGGGDLGYEWLRGDVSMPRYLPIAGLVFAAVVQHWAYYKVWKKLDTDIR